jgi:hypothetical protein
VNNEKAHKRASEETYTVLGKEARPIDGTAARVTSPGVHWEPGFKPPCRIWKEPPPTCEPPAVRNSDPSFTDYRGSVKGRMRIVGYLGAEGGFPTNPRPRSEALQ